MGFILGAVTVSLIFFGEKFEVPKDLVHSYVKAVIVTEIHTLLLYLGNELVKTFLPLRAQI